MASKRRLRRNACVGKIRHASREHATIHARKLAASGVVPYACRYCNAWHIGHIPRLTSRKGSAV